MFSRKDIFEKEAFQNRRFEIEISQKQKKRRHRLNELKKNTNMYLLHQDIDFEISTDKKKIEIFLNFHIPTIVHS